jgi:hypothetical protein
VDQASKEEEEQNRERRKRRKEEEKKIHQRTATIEILALFDTSHLFRLQGTSDGVANWNMNRMTHGGDRPNGLPINR